MTVLDGVGSHPLVSLAARLMVVLMGRGNLANVRVEWWQLAGKVNLCM